MHGAACTLPTLLLLRCSAPLTAPRFDWLSDEIDGLKDADDIPRIQGLMQAAVADYLSIPLWVQYLE